MTARPEARFCAYNQPVRPHVHDFEDDGSLCACGLTHTYCTVCGVQAEPCDGDDTPRPTTNYLLAVDIETTGLDPERDHMLEFAAILLDNDLNEIATTGSVVILPTAPNWQDRMNDFVRDMHTTSGLLDRIAARDGVTVAQADSIVRRWLESYGLHEPRSLMIVGSSCRLDLNFVERRMPRVADLLHYRMIDGSGIREALLRWAPDAVYEWPNKHANHRALDDIRGSIAELRRYRELLSERRAA